MKKILIFLIPVFALLTIGSIFVHPKPAHADAFVANNLIDDNVFSNTGAMTISQINNWLNANFASSCISQNNGFSAPDPTGYSPSSGFTYGGPVSAGQVIYDAAAAYGLNPQVLLTTLQKEEGLVRGDGPYGCGALSMSAALGYGCTDSGTNSHSYTYTNGTDAGTLPTPLYYTNGSPVNSVSNTCVNSSLKAGFSEQMIHAAWLLKFGQQRSEGNTSWDVQLTNSPQSGDRWNNSDDPQTCYGGPMTQGSFKRCSTDTNPVFYDGYITIDGVSTHMDTGGTAALYWYTPHFHGNQNFVSLFTQWFGPTTSLMSGVTLTITQQPDSTPARGETVTYNFSLSNTFTVPVTLSGVGAVGRLGSLNGANRDLGWQGPVTLQPNTSQQFSFTSTLQDTGTMYVWPAVLYQGAYVQYNNWGSTLAIHAPNLTLSQPLMTSSSTIYAGQDVTFSAKLKNNEPQAIKYDAVGIPVKFYDRYSYDAVWVGPGTLGPGAEVTLSGTRNIDKPGPFTYWVSDNFASTYQTVGSVKQFTSVQASPNFSVSGLSLSSSSPVIGQNITSSFTVTNNLPVGIDVDAVGIVGRLGTFNGPNRDIGWQGPIHFNANETKTFNGFSRTITDVGTHYYWIGILYQGNYLQYNNWGSTIVSRAPSFSVAGISFSTTTPAVGQNLGASITVTNNLPVGIDVDAVGIVGRLGTFNGPNRDIGWQGPIHFNANETKTFNGFSRTITDVGTHYYWIGILYQGNYLQYNNWGSTIVSHN